VGLILQVPTIALVMGPKGVIGRILCPKYGGYLTFGALSKGQESAPGQPTLADLSHVYRVGQLGRDTKVFGIIGNPVYHSKSPILHNAAFEKCSIDAVYVPFLVEDLAEFLSVYSVPDFCGFRYFVFVFLYEQIGSLLSFTSNESLVLEVGLLTFWQCNHPP
jgi:3-dehydroquinate dehydratase/shikimate dehydrogenase